MRLRALLIALTLTSLIACDSRDKDSSANEEMVVTSSRTSGGFAAMDAAAPAPPPPPATSMPSGEVKQAPKLAYSHSLQLEMAADKVEPRYQRARDACLNMPNYGCILVNASISGGDEQSGTPPYAGLTVRLPHDKIDAFQKDMLAPLEGEKEGSPVVRASSTNAEDLTYVIADVDRRLEQLKDYRDRLTELAKRPGANVEDLIQIEAKISETQSQIEAIVSQQRELNLRVDTEFLSISLSALPTIGNVQSPLARAWREGFDTLGRSAAEVLTFVISTVLWLPIIAVGLWLLIRIWRLVGGRGFRFTRGVKASAGDQGEA